MQAVNILAINRNRLRQFLEAESGALARTLRVYAWRAGLPSDEDSVGDLLNETVAEALHHADRYDPDRSPRAWLLGIAANLVRREQTAVSRLRAREPLAADLSPLNGTLSEEEVFERLTLLKSSVETSGGDEELLQQVRDAMGELSASDQLVLHLFPKAV